MTNQKAFIFDFDGVIVNNEHLWIEREPWYINSILLKDAAERILPKTYGLSVHQVYDLAIAEGYKGTVEEFDLGYDKW